MANTKGIGLSLPVIFDNAFKEHNLDGTHDNLCGAIKFVSTYAELKAACEDAAVHKIYMLANCIGSTTIAPTSYTYIDGLGHELDWNGSGGGIMFWNGSATDVVFENVNWLLGGNWYYAVRSSASWRFSSCTSAHNVVIQINGIDNVINTKCSFKYIKIGVTGCKISDSIVSLLWLDSGCADFLATNIKMDGSTYARIYIIQAATSVSDRDVHFANSLLKGGAVYNHCVYFLYSGAGAGNACRNIKFTGCTLIPQASVDPCIELEDDANLVVQELELTSCTFRNGATGILVPANATLTDPRFVTNVYDNMTAKYTFTGTVNNPIFCMDG